MLKDKLIVITGGANGIGLELAKICVEYYVNVAIIDKSADQILTAMSMTENDYIIGYKADISNKADVHYAMQKIALHFKRPIDILVNMAGIGASGALEETHTAILSKLLNVNLMGAINCIEAVLPSMKNTRSGQIINVSSGQVFFKLPTWGAYTVSKAALSMLSEILHYELKPQGIIVTTVYPFMVNTGFYNNISGETFIGRLSMKFVSLYSMNPKRVAAIILNAIEHKKRIENVTILNNIAKMIDIVPGFRAIISTCANMLLNKNKK